MAQDKPRAEDLQKWVTEQLRDDRVYVEQGPQVEFWQAEPNAQFL